MRLMTSAVIGLALAAPAVRADDPPAVPRQVPLTRPEMKQYLEDMKTRTPRIVLPELTAAEKARLGEREANYENRLRALYLPAGDAQRGAFGGGGNREPEVNMSLDTKFKTALFWIVSRTNNCQYCMGHQESKLLNAGMKEDEIAALDGDWSEFTLPQREAFAFARKFTLEPQRLSQADIDHLRIYYKDLQILEMVLSMAGNNAINRWKEGVGVPQSKNGGGFGLRGGDAAKAARAEPQSYLTPTAPAYSNKITKVAPLVLDPATGNATRQTVCERPPLETRAEVEKALEAGRARQARLPLVEEARARALLPADWPAGPLPQWVRLLANFPGQGKNRILSQRVAEEKGELTPLLKAQVSWIIARQDRAWYAAGESKRRLNELGWSDDQVFKLDGDWAGFTPTERAMFTVARKLAAAPVVLSDAEVAQAVKLAGPRDVVQLVQYVTTRASFDRITEAAGLQLEK